MQWIDAHIHMWSWKERRGEREGWRGRVDVCIYGWVGRWMDEWMDGGREVGMNGWMIYVA